MVLEQMILCWWLGRQIRKHFYALFQSEECLCVSTKIPLGNTRGRNVVYFHFKEGIWVRLPSLPLSLSPASSLLCNVTQINLTTGHSVTKRSTGEGLPLRFLSLCSFSWLQYIKLHCVSNITRATFLARSVAPASKIFACAPSLSLP